MTSDPQPRILITGVAGQIGTALAPVLRELYGRDNVICTGRRRWSGEVDGPYFYLDVTDYESLCKIIVEQRIDWIVHNASVLSAIGERNPPVALKTNLDGLHNVLEASRKYNLRCLCPSTIAVFGDGCPKDNTPDDTVLKPTTIYGITKVHVELMCEYYAAKFGVDARSLRYPGIISNEALPGGGTTDYACEIFYEAIQKGFYECYIAEDQRLPMMYMSDCLKCTVDLLTVDASKLKRRVYNVGAVSFTPKEIADEIKKHIPSFSITYKPDFRQEIAASWPRVIDDSNAREDWGWDPKVGLSEMVDDMLKVIGARLKSE